LTIQLPKTKSEKLSMTVWLAILVVITVGSLLPRMSPPGQQFGMDKLLHATSFVLLATLPLYGIPDRKAAILLALSVAPYGYLLEFMQRMVPGREFSAQDLIANNLGALVGLFIGSIVRIRTRYFAPPGRVS
jgi:VanZ family protein